MRAALRLLRCARCVRGDCVAPALAYLRAWLSRCPRACRLLALCRLGGWLLALVGVVIGLAGLIRVLFYNDPISD